MSGSVRVLRRDAVARCAGDDFIVTFVFFEGRARGRNKRAGRFGQVRLSGYPVRLACRLRVVFECDSARFGSAAAGIRGYRKNIEKKTQSLEQRTAVGSGSLTRVNGCVAHSRACGNVGGSRRLSRLIKKCARVQQSERF